MSLRSTFAELGARDALLYALGQALERASGGRARVVKYRLVAQPVGSGRAAAPLRPDPATCIAVVAEGDPRVAGFPRPPPVLERRWRAGAQCTAAWVRERFAGFIWVQRGAYDEDAVRCRYVLDDPAACVWDYDVHVEPAFRLGRTMARLWAQVDAGLAAQGVRWSCSRISAFNAASLAAHARLGIVDLGAAVFVVLGPVQAAWLPGRRLPRMSWSDRGAPVLRVPAPASGVRHAGAASVAKSSPAVGGGSGPAA